MSVFTARYEPNICALFALVFVFEMSSRGLLVIDNMCNKETDFMGSARKFFVLA
jgi:hypothetical protein